MHSASLIFSTILCTLSVATSGLAFAYSINGLMQPYFTSGWIVTFSASLNIGGMLGSALAGFLLANYGRRFSLQCAHLLGIVAWLAFLYATNLLIEGTRVPFALLLLSRIITGISAGIVIPSSVAYLLEIAPPNLLPFYSFLPQLGVVSGLTFGYMSSVSMLSVSVALLNTVVMSLLFGLTHFLLPESPQWLLSKEVTGSTSLDKVSSRKEKNDQSSGSLISYLFPCASISTDNQFKLRIGCIVMILQQATGINGLIFSANSYCDRAGPSLANTCTVSVGASQVLFVLLTIPFLNRYSRVKLLVTSSYIMLAANVLLGSLPLFSFDTSILTLVAIVIFLLGFCIGWGPLPMAIVGDMFSVEQRGFAIGAAICVNWLASFVVTLVFEPLLLQLGPLRVFWSLALFCFLGSVFVEKVLSKSLQPSIPLSLIDA